MWSGAMMLQHLGHPEAAEHLQLAFEFALREGLGTRDVGGRSSTAEFTAAVLAAINVIDVVGSTKAGAATKPAGAPASS
jgi:tartrate dehydrogenase/decarboxylase/D-malate dehydrogenase